MELAAERQISPVASNVVHNYGMASNTDALQHPAPSAATTELQHDGLSASGAHAHHGKFCTGQFGDISDIFSRGRRELRKFASGVYGCVPASNLFVNGFAIRQLICITRR